jgi:hypothetical protein
VPALTLRDAPFDRIAGALAVAGGAWLALFVVVAAGPDLTVGALVWVAVAGACACLGGLVAGSHGSVAPAALLLGAAVAAAALAASAVPAVHTPRLRAADLAPPAAHRPGATKPRAATPSPAHIVRAFYAALDAHAYARAWARLTPAFRARVGGYERWRAGYATTLGHTVDAVDPQPGGRVELTLTATDRTPCGGTTTQQFAVTWQLNQGRATALSATRLAGQDPAAAC